MTEAERQVEERLSERVGWFLHGEELAKSELGLIRLAYGNEPPKDPPCWPPRIEAMWHLANDHLSQARQLAEAERERDDFAEALGRYGRHDERCDRYGRDFALRFPGTPATCLCGFSAALASPDPPASPAEGQE